MFGYNSSSTKVRNTVACYGHRPKFLYSVSTTYEDPRAAVAGSGSVSCHLPKTAANCMLNKAGPVCGLGLGCPHLPAQCLFFSRCVVTAVPRPSTKVQRPVCQCRPNGLRSISPSSTSQAKGKAVLILPRTPCVLHPILISLILLYTALIAIFLCPE